MERSRALPWQAYANEGWRMGSALTIARAWALRGNVSRETSQNSPLLRSRRGLKEV
jgi:hypothetical protein